MSEPLSASDAAFPVTDSISRGDVAVVETGVGGGVAVIEEVDAFSFGGHVVSPFEVEAQGFVSGDAECAALDGEVEFVAADL